MVSLFIALFNNFFVKPDVLNRMYRAFFVCVSLRMVSDFFCKSCKTVKSLGEVVNLHSPSTRYPPTESMATMLISPVLKPQYLPTLSK